MNNSFGPITQPYIRSTLEKNTTRVLALLIFYETRNSPKKDFKVLSCVIYTIIRNYVCIDYLDFQSEQLSEIPVGAGGGFKHRKKVMTKYWELEFQIC